jgi:hypothetical protein
MNRPRILAKPRKDQTMKTQYPNLFSATEAAIISKVQEWFLSQTDTRYAIRVFDGEETSCQITRNVVEINAAVAITDETSFVIYEERGERIGSILFIHGNEGDVLSDFGWDKNNAKAAETMDAMWTSIQSELDL